MSQGTVYLKLTPNPFQLTLPLEKLIPIISLLSRALLRIRSTPPRIIASPPTRTYASSTLSQFF